MAQGMNFGGPRRNMATETGVNPWRRAGVTAILVAALLISAASSASAQCGSDPGNDSFGSATDLGSQCGITGADIDCTGDADYYRFQAPSSGSYNFYTAGGTDTFLSLYDGIYGFLASDDNSAQDSNASINYSLTQGATYYITVGEYGNDATGTYHLYVSGCSSGGDCSSDENDDDFSVATTIPGCATQTAQIDCTDDIDFFTFTAQTAGSYTFTVGASNSVYVTLYDSGRNVVQQTNSSVSTSLGAGGTVFVRVAPVNNGEVFQYGLTATGCSSGGCGNDSEGDSIPTAVILNDCGVTSASIDCLGGADYFGFTPILLSCSL